MNSTHACQAATSYRCSENGLGSIATRERGTSNDPSRGHTPVIAAGKYIL